MNAQEAKKVFAATAKPEKPRILLVDVETSPNLGYSWGKWDQNIIKFVRESYIISFAHKWLGEKQVHVKALPDFLLYKRTRTSDKELLRYIRGMLDEASVVVAHNGNSFDMKVINSRLIFNGFRPPSPFQTVDTLQVARRYFKFNSNKMGDIGPYIKEGEKLRTGGFDLWEDCLAGKKDAWDRMKRYNSRDVLLLERVYKRLLPWIENHPNLNVLIGTRTNCPNCGSESLQRRGLRLSARTGVRQSYQCQSCGHWCSGGHKSVGIVLR